MRELEEIRNSSESDARKRELAQARLDVFFNHRFQGKTLREHAREFADAHDMTWEHGFDPATLTPVNRVACKGTFMGRTIPTL